MKDECYWIAEIGLNKALLERTVWVEVGISAI